jgi:hypothetical protein
MITTVYKLLNRTLFIYLTNWKNQVREIIDAIETKTRQETNMKMAICKTINKNTYLYIERWKYNVNKFIEA